MSRTEEEIVEEMQLVAEQMVKDDLEENPDIANEYFDCACCGKNKCMAGSIQYGKYRLCNDCVLLAETGFALKRITNIEQLIKAMEDNRLEELCSYIKNEETRSQNLN